MTRLIMMNPEKLREKTDEQNITDQTNWVCFPDIGSTLRTMILTFE